MNTNHLQLGTTRMLIGVTTATANISMAMLSIHPTTLCHLPVLQNLMLTMF
jgi:hypothetical protein